MNDNERIDFRLKLLQVHAGIGQLLKMIDSDSLSWFSISSKLVDASILLSNISFEFNQLD